MRFEWNELKNRINITKHGFGFETAKQVFGDPFGFSIQDRTVEGEERWQTMGMIGDVIVLVAHTWSDNSTEQVIRLISARKATRSERRVYATNRQRHFE